MERLPLLSRKMVLPDRWSFQTGSASIHSNWNSKLKFSGRKIFLQTEKWSFQTEWSFERGSFQTDFTLYIRFLSFAWFQYHPRCIPEVTQIRHKCNNVLVWDVTAITRLEATHFWYTTNVTSETYICRAVSTGWWQASAGQPWPVNIPLSKVSWLYI